MIALPLRAVLIALCLLLAVPAARAGDTFRFDRTGPGGSVALRGELWLPAGQATVPAIILSHGSGGLNASHEPRYAEALTAMGIAVLAIDHFGPRNITSLVRDQSQLTTLDMVRDAFAALDALARHPRIRADRIGIAGFSKGGSVALRTALLRQVEARPSHAPRFALHVAYYPGCADHWLQPRTTGAPIRFLLGADDTYTGVQPCQDFASELRAAGADVDVVVYPGAMHGYDHFGGDYFVAGGQNASACRFEEQPDGSWLERSSNTPFRPGTASGAAAARACVRNGVSGGPNSAARAASLRQLQDYATRYLLR